MTDTQRRAATGTWQIVVAALLYAFTLYGLVRMPYLLENGNTAEIGVSVVGVLLWAGLGTWALIVGLNRRRAASQ